MGKATTAKIDAVTDSQRFTDALLATCPIATAIGGGT
jgi:hypothetical protein